MLVLSRKLQQSIRIGDNVTVTILRVKGNTIRIGIEAPDAVRIVRGELSDFQAPIAADAVPTPATTDTPRPSGTNRIRSLTAPPTGLSSRIAEMGLTPSLGNLSTTTSVGVPLPR